jgi:hypothetical protein
LFTAHLRVGGIFVDFPTTFFSLSGFSKDTFSVKQEQKHKRVYQQPDEATAKRKNGNQKTRTSASETTTSDKIFAKIRPLTSKSGNHPPPSPPLAHPKSILIVYPSNMHPTVV